MGAPDPIPMIPKTPPPTRGVPITLDKLRHLRYTLASVRHIREAFGEERLSTDLNPEDLGTLLWIGLRDEDPTLTKEQVEDLVDLRYVEACMEAIEEALGARGKRVLGTRTGGSSPLEMKT